MIRSGSDIRQRIHPHPHQEDIMDESRSLITYIESAIDRNPLCACGAPMQPVEHDGALYLECATHDEERRGILARVWSLFGHDRRLLFVADELAA
jgi:hypothetical protein